MIRSVKPARRLAAAGLTLVAGVLPGGVPAQAAAQLTPPISATAAVRATDGTYDVRWQAAPYVRSVAVYASTSASPLTSHGTLVGSSADGHVTVRGLDPLSRWYFILAPTALPIGTDVATKVVTVDGVKNARDLGGYPAAYGLRIRWGSVFRSARLTPATESGREELARLGLVEDIDFRSTAEATAEGVDPVPAEVTHIGEPVGDPDQALPPDPNTPPSTGDFIEDNYRLLVTNPNLGRQFLDALNDIATANGRPVLYHCTGGNHRTGWMTVILLKVLGVADDVIAEDYLMSTGTSPTWLAAAYDQVDRSYGSFDTYLARLGVTAALMARLRLLLLEPAP